MRRILFLSLVLAVFFVCRAYGQQVEGTSPGTNITSGTYIVSGFGTPVFISSGTPNSIVVTGSVRLVNGDAGGMGVASALDGGYIDLGTGSKIEATAFNTSTGIVGATGIASQGTDSTVTGRDVVITVTGDRPYGVLARSNGFVKLAGLSTINVNSNASSPDAGYGIVAYATGTVTAENVKITAGGTNGALSSELYGILALESGKVNVTGSADVSINAINSYGVRAESGAVQLNTLQENITGTTSAYAVYASTGGTVIVSGASGTSNITVSANNAYGIGLHNNSGAVSINNANITVNGVTNVAAVELADNTGGVSLSVAGSSLKSGGDGIRASNSIANINFQNTSLQNAVNVFRLSGSTVNFTGNNVTLSGSASADAASVLNVSLSNESLWNLSGASNIALLVLNNSRVNIGPGASVQNVNFLSSGGQIYYVDGVASNRSAVFTQTAGATPGIIGMQFNTPSSYDKLVLGTGSSGSYNVDLIDINPAGKNPKYFTVPDMVTSSPTLTFHLLKPVYTLGIYQYNLTELHNGNLFGFEAQYVGIDPVAGHEISQSLLGSMAGGSKLIETASNNLMKRLGDLRLSKEAGSPQGSLWVRGYGKQYKLKDDMDGSVYGLEAGYDTALDYDYKYHFGIMGGYGHENTNFTPNSNGTVNAPSAGLYGMWIADNGFYADITGRYFWLSYENNINPLTTAPFQIEENASGYAFSFELGKRFQMDSLDKWFIEPRAQYNYGKTGGYAAEKKGIEMRTEDYVSSLGALGLNLGCRIPGSYDNIYEPYVRAALKYEFDGKAKAAIDDTPYSKDYGGARIEGGIGLNAQLGSNFILYAEASYENGSSFEGFGENIGIRFSFGEPRENQKPISKKEALAAILEADREEQRKLAEDMARKEEEEKARKEREARQAAINTGSDDVLEQEKAVAQERRLKPVLKSFNLGMANFAVGKSELTQKAQDDIKKMAEDIKALEFKQITIEGHTDSTGSDQFNKSLSNARAKAVFLEFVKNGIPEDKMTYIGFASKMPIADNKTDSGRAKNRRVEIFVE